MTAIWLAFLAAQGAAATPPGNYEALPPGEVDLRPDAVGPESLRDFNLGGERQASPPAPREPAPQPRATQPTPAPVQPAPRPSPPVAPTRTPEPPAADSGTRIEPATPQPSVEAVVDPAPPPVTSEPSLPPAARVELPGVPQDQGPPSWMWIVVGLLALLVGYAVFRSRRPVVAAGPREAPVPLRPGNEKANAAKDVPPSTDRPAQAPVSAREPAPAAPAPPPPPPPAPSSEGFVGIKQAPELLLDLTPLRAALTEEEFSIDYAVTMANRGNGPALDIGIDSAMVMAGPQQEQKIAEFIAHPPAGGKAALQMLNSHGQAQLRGTIRLPIAQMTVIPLEGRQLIMPTIVLLPRHRQGRGQPARFVIGRKPKEGDKLAPMRADLGPRTWRDLIAKKA